MLQQLYLFDYSGRLFSPPEERRFNLVRMPNISTQTLRPIHNTVCCGFRTRGLESRKNLGRTHHFWVSFWVGTELWQAKKYWAAAFQFSIRLSFFPNSDVSAQGLISGNIRPQELNHAIGTFNWIHPSYSDHSFPVVCVTMVAGMASGQNPGWQWLFHSGKNTLSHWSCLELSFDCSALTQRTCIGKEASLPILYIVASV